MKARGETEHKETIAITAEGKKHYMVVQSSAGMLPSSRVVDTIIISICFIVVKFTPDFTVESESIPFEKLYNSLK